MANKFAKDFENGTNRDFGSFTPKEEPAKDMEGAKAEGGSTSNGSGSPDVLSGKNTGNKTNTNSSNSSSSQNGGKSSSSSSFNSQSSQSSDGKSQGKMADAKQKLDNANPVKKAEQGAKADIKSSLSGRDRNEVLQEQKDKDSDPKNMAKSAAKHKATRHAGSKLGKAFGGKGLGNVAGAAASKTTGALTGIKGLGASMLGGIKGAGAAIAATATKAGAAVAGALNVSTAVGTALVLSGTIAAATIPTAGVIGYGVSHYTQQRDGCVPEEYDDNTGSSGPEAAVEWAIQIANDDSFNYGIKDKDGGYANRCGCYFCGTNDKKVKLSGDERYYKTYVCMTFVTAAYAHGAKDPTALEICQGGGSFDSHDGVFEQMPNFTKVGLMKDLNVSDLQVGDVLVHYASDNSSGHMSLYAGDGNIVDASGGGFDPGSISLKQGAAERYLKAKWNPESSKNFVMRYKGGSHQNTVSTSGNVATSTYATGRVSRNAQDVVNGACAWAVAITEDNSFHYGHGQDAHHGGCYFCHTQPAVKHSYLDWEKSYCCNPFVYSAFAHGGGDSDMLAQCQAGHNSNTGIFTDNKHFKNLGRPSFSSLQKGDVLWYNTGSKCHYALYLGNNQLAEAGGSDDNKRNSEKWNHSIRVRKITSYGNFTNASRYIGSGGSPMFAGALYNDEVAGMTADDGCGGEMDGAEEADAYIGKGMKKITAGNGEEYIILDFDREAVKKLGQQGSAQCYIYSIGYCDLILGGKFRCSIEGSADTKHDNMRATYGKNNGGEDGNPGNIGGRQHDVASTDAMRKLAIEEIKQGRPVIFYIAGNSYGVSTSMHWICICGWTADAGSDPKWDDLVCCDPAYFYGSNDGLHAIKGFHDHGGHTVATFEGWKPGKGQSQRK